MQRYLGLSASGGGPFDIFPCLFDKTAHAAGRILFPVEFKASKRWDKLALNVTILNIWIGNTGN